MSQSDARLKQMIAQLARMADDDRAFVLDHLGPDARGKLGPLVGDTVSPAAVSSGLQLLLREVARGQNPKTMTGTAIAALRSLHRDAPDPVSKLTQPSDSLAERVSAFMRRSAR